jgi:hypothetical protein
MRTATRIALPSIQPVERLSYNPTASETTAETINTMTVWSSNDSKNKPNHDLLGGDSN